MAENIKNNVIYMTKKKLGLMCIVFLLRVDNKVDVFWQFLLSNPLVCMCLCVFLQLNEARTNIMDTNHRLMALAAEFSIKQATTLSLQQEIKEKEHQVRALLHSQSVSRRRSRFPI